MSSKKNINQNSFVSHLSELRSRLLKSFLFLILSFIICYFFSEEIYKFLVKRYSDAVLQNHLERRLIFTALHEAFLTYLKVAFFASVFITSPIFLSQIWKFIAPGLYTNEKIKEPLSLCAICPENFDKYANLSTFFDAKIRKQKNKVVPQYGTGHSKPIPIRS